jgi:hypothetical protein
MAKFELMRTFRTSKELFHTGTYYVPRDMDRAIADKAEADGFGAWVPEPERVAITDEPAKRGPGRPRKEPAPENKALAGPSEDKDGVTFRAD